MQQGWTGISLAARESLPWDSPGLLGHSEVNAGAVRQKCEPRNPEPIPGELMAHNPSLPLAIPCCAILHSALGDSPWCPALALHQIRSWDSSCLNLKYQQLHPVNPELPELTWARGAWQQGWSGVFGRADVSSCVWDWDWCVSGQTPPDAQIP